MSKLEAVFWEPFLNRIGKIIIFNTLDKDIVKRIVLKTIRSLEKELPGLSERNLKIELEDDVVDFLSEVGYNEKYRARNLQRVVEEYCLNKISSFLANNIHIKDKAFHFQIVNNTLTLGIHDITPIVSSN